MLDARHEIGDTTFVGYDSPQAEARLLFLEVDGEQVSEAGVGTGVRFALDKSPFYAESGGQVGDQGQVTHDHFTIMVTDVQKEGSFGSYW